MGIYLNPGSGAFQEALASEIYVDKTGLIAYCNAILGTKQKYICVSRPRRFGKSMAAEMLAAYYGRENDAKALFDDLEIAHASSYQLHMNQYNVIFMNIQKFLSHSHDIQKMKSEIEKALLWDLLEVYPDFRYYDTENLARTMLDIYKNTKIPFVVIIDEWDCIFREKQHDQEAQKIYLDFLRDLLKDAEHIKLAYMTGILPIKKYGTHSALNMFDEFSMIEPRRLATYTGFTEAEVEDLCQRYNMNFDEIKRWYDGYTFKQAMHIYSPRSVVTAMLSREYGAYWTQTETYEALKIYIEMNFDGLKDIIIKLLAGGRQAIDTGTFTNDMTTFQCVDDVLTLLIHLGYLAYDTSSSEVFIPNSEISGEFVNAVKGAGWDEIVTAVKESERLLQATWQKDANAVAKAIEKAHMETSILTYNDENALAYTMSLAYYNARIYYTVIRECPTGKGFADLIFLPRKNHPEKPALVVELKWDKTVDTAIGQIKDNQYEQILHDYRGNVLLVGINYNKKNKKHECKIEEWNVAF